MAAPPTMAAAASKQIPTDRTRALMSSSSGDPDQEQIVILSCRSPDGVSPAGRLKLGSTIHEPAQLGEPQDRTDKQLSAGERRATRDLHAGGSVSTGR